MTLRVVELFSGVGTQRMALRNLGIDHEVVAMCEIDKYAIQSYEAIHGTTKNLGDITQVDPTTLEDFDLLTYSFPCQSLSAAGKQEGLIRGKTRSGLLYECEKIIEAKKPRFLLLENVKALVGTKFKPQFDEWLAYLESLGYTNYWQVLNAKDYGIPQSRERVFVVSILGEHCPYEFPKPIPLTKTVSDLLEEDVDSKYLMSNIAIEKMKRYQPRQLLNKNISPTLTTELSHGTGKNFHPRWVQIIGKYRMPTPTECFRLMGVSDDDIEKLLKSGVSDTQLYKQAGNSIVVDVLVHLFNEMLKAVNVDVESI